MLEKIKINGGIVELKTHCSVPFTKIPIVPKITRRTKNLGPWREREKKNEK